MYIRTVRVPSSRGKVNEYVRVVESYREQGKVKQRTIADLGRKDLRDRCNRRGVVAAVGPGGDDGGWATRQGRG
jgi:hypothetical protein